MEDGEGDGEGLKFDFERFLEGGPSQPTASVPVIHHHHQSGFGANYTTNTTYSAATDAVSAATALNRFAGGSSQTVCRQWLHSRCTNGESCPFLHQYDETKMPICQFETYGGCDDAYCVYKHQKKDLSTSNRFFQKDTNYSQHTQQSVNKPVQVSKPATTDSAMLQPMPHQPLQQQQEVARSKRYFIVKSCSRENLKLSVQQGVWATQRSNEAKLNEAFDSVENVILIFSVNKSQHFQGCAKMTSKIGGSAGEGNWKYAHGTAQYGGNFCVKWLKLCELSFHKTQYLRNPYNENLPVKVSRDCQELEPSIGEQLASLLYLEPDSELMAVSLAAESKREEEKAKGVDPENGTEDPDIVPAG